MVIRTPTFTDVPAMIEVLRWAHQHSVYAETAEIDDREANRILCNVIQRHNARGENGTWVQVSETAGKITGLIVGVLNRVYSIGTKCSASDLFWVGTNEASARDKIGLLWTLTEWAKAHKWAIDIVCVANGAFGDPDKAEKIMVKLGFSREGGLYRMAAK